MGHRNNTVHLLACGYVATVTSTPQTRPSQQALRLQPMGFQLFVHFKGMRASLRASVQSLKSPAAGSVSRPPTCSSRRAEGHRHRGSPFTGEVVQKHPAPLSYILFYTKSQRFRVQKVKAISSRPPHGADRALNPKGGEGGGYQICLSVPGQTTEVVPPSHSLCIGASDMHRSRVREDLLQCVGIAGCWYHCSGPGADRTTYLNSHNSLLVCHACDQSC
ncbi:DNA-directed RNA polymerase subunit beta'' [Dissostichus eleginoides]|uniref:DNA-directed RNA polymerase subunit beta n=1 Tax=Dissostichus eleginoides TaxID=100907 RepID=A0AAD9FLH9_DISEL|nr:DNA-directed RNA polymerase subunit beta'' [Dissostichus eleginoides]